VVGLALGDADGGGPVVTVGLAVGRATITGLAVVTVGDAVGCAEGATVTGLAVVTVGDHV